jgi:acetyltransferase
MKKLDAALPPIWSRANPADIAGDADAERYAVTLECRLKDGANDAVLVMNVPTALASAADAAKSVIAVTERHRKKGVPPKPVFTMWMGENGPASEAFEAAGIPNYPTESAAIYGFMHLVRYRESRDLLMATPPNLPQDFRPDAAVVRPIVDGVLQEKRSWLDPIELTRVLSAYGIPITRAALARAMRMKPSHWQSPIWQRVSPSSLKFNRRTSCISRKSAACGSTLPAKARCATPGRTS